MRVSEERREKEKEEKRSERWKVLSEEKNEHREKKDTLKSNVTVVKPGTGRQETTCKWE